MEVMTPAHVLSIKLSICTALLPKDFTSESAGIVPLPLDLVFLEECDTVTVSDAIGTVRRDFHSAQGSCPFVCT